MPSVKKTGLDATVKDIQIIPSEFVENPRRNPYFEQEQEI